MAGHVADELMARRGQVQRDPAEASGGDAVPRSLGARRGRLSEAVRLVDGAVGSDVTLPAS
jgi:hypothetical protein